MGIDVYMRWKGQTQAEKQAQYTGFSIAHGHVGYLREAYHGEPYATRLLLPEAFASKESTAKIPASVLRERLPRVQAAAMERERAVYKAKGKVTLKTPSVKAFADFVELAEAKEKETGKPVTIMVSY